MAFRFLTAGESHGKALMGIVDGIPSGLGLTAEHIQAELKRRKLGYGRGHRQKIEDETVEILTGVRDGKTLGSPVGILLPNRDWKNWETIMAVGPGSPDATKRKLEVPRPGHADLVGGIKYRHGDMRNVLERASARETAMRVAVASVARRLLRELGISLGSRVVRIGSAVDTTVSAISVEDLNSAVDDSPVRCLGAEAARAMVAEVEKAKEAGETLGGVIEVVASGVPVGLGSYAQWDRRLEAEIGRQFLSLNAIKGVEIGLGFGAAGVAGSGAHDEYLPGERKGRVRYASNRSGGIDGGMSTGQVIIVRAGMKPLATLMQPLRSVKMATNEAASAHVERSDVCAVPAAAVIGESLLALVLAAAILEKFGGDSMEEILPRVEDWHGSTSR